MSHQISRRDMLGAAALASGAAAGLGVASASGAAPTAPTSPRSKQSNGFALRKQKPQVVRHGGSITHADAASFPVLEGNRGSAALMRIDPGGLREPHWHPDCWEMEVPLRGTGTLGVVNPDGTWSQQKLGPGDIGFIPQGFAHYIENTGSVPLEFVLVFNVTKLSTIDLSVMFEGVPTRTFAHPMGMHTSAFSGATKGSTDVVIADG